ncbi:MAG: hypothetical protein NVS9B10_29250 [Nevskia sp.]
MTPDPAEFAVPEDSELHALIATLQAVDQRLAVITAGEVDTVTARDGQPFMLRQAQEQLRGSEAVNQAAVLDALPAPITLLNAQGRIVAANAAWRSFAASLPVPPADGGLGCNYLDVCDHGSGDDAAVARAVAAGVLAVLTGAAPGYASEYACHSPTEQRWFLMTATPLAGGHRTGAVVMHVDITPHRKSEQSLQRFGAAMDATLEAIYLVDRSEMRYVHVNDAACRIEQRSREALLQTPPWAALGLSRAALEQIYDEIIDSGVPAAPIEMPWRSKGDGAPQWLELRRRARRGQDRWFIVVVVRDITERRAAELRIRRLHRVHAMLSAINALIVRVHDRDELFREACRIATELGGFRTAWIGMIEPGALDGRVVASAGHELAGLGQVRLTALADGRDGAHPACRALWTSQAVLCNDIAADAGAGWCGGGPQPGGSRSVGCFPLRIGGRTAAVLVLFADRTDVFDDEETRLLLELAGEISLAIGHIENERRLDYLADYDDLTGLAKRSLFLERLAQHLRVAQPGARPVAVFLVDLERFKSINDSLGQPAGDSLLKQVAAWLTRELGDAHLLARIGADRFAGVLPDRPFESDAVQRLETALAAFQEYPFRLDEAAFRISAKAGIAQFPADGTTADSLFRNAEAALKQAKADGERCLPYTGAMGHSASGRLTLENRLRHALDRGEFELHYQPKIRVGDGSLAGAEALLRCRDRHGGLTPPPQFIPILEQTGLIHEVGFWALREALACARRWLAAGHPAVRIAVNVSPLQLRPRGFVAQLPELVGSVPQAAASLELEITESVIMADVENSIAVLKAIRALGVSIAIDDFGTGFSSLNYLARLPVDTLKIDRSFVTDMSPGAEGLALVAAIIGLAHALKLKVVAEGVETEEQVQLLRQLHCDELQGFLLGRPVAAEVFRATHLVPTPA